MPSGIFTVVCPTCGREISTNDAGQHVCVACRTTYISSFGYLIAEPTTRLAAPRAGVALS